MSGVGACALAIDAARARMAKNVVFVCIVANLCFVNGAVARVALTGYNRFAGGARDALS